MIVTNKSTKNALVFQSVQIIFQTGFLRRSDVFDIRRVCDRHEHNHHELAGMFYFVNYPLR